MYREGQKVLILLDKKPQYVAFPKELERLNKKEVTIEKKITYVIKEGWTVNLYMIKEIQDSSLEDRDGLDVIYVPECMLRNSIKIVGGR